MGEGFAIQELVERAKRAPDGYAEFVQVPDLSAGVYVLARGAVDRQTPHTEYEVYHVVHGRARFTSGSLEREVRPGDTLFVPANEEHRFHDIVEELVLLVVFGPSEGMRAPHSR